MSSCRFFVRGIQKDGQYFEYTFIRPKFYFEPGRALPPPGPTTIHGPDETCGRSLLKKVYYI